LKEELKRIEFRKILLWIRERKKEKARKEIIETKTKQKECSIDKELRQYMRGKL